MTRLAIPLSHPVTGERLDLWRGHRSLEEVFFSTAALPAWMTSTGTYAFTDLTNAAGGYGSIAPTPAAAGTTGQLSANFLVATQQHRQVAITVEGARLSAVTGLYDWGLGLDVSALTTGITFRHRAGQTTAEWVIGAASPNIIPVNYGLQSPSSSSTVRRNLTLLYDRIDKFALVLSDDSCIAALDTSALSVVEGSIRPRLFVTTQDTTARHVRCHKFRVDLWD